MKSSLLPFFGVVRVSGGDRATFLHNQLSNHIEALAEGQACYATYNTPKGRVIANMLVINRGEDLLFVFHCVAKSSNICSLFRSNFKRAFCNSAFSISLDKV